MRGEAELLQPITFIESSCDTLLSQQYGPLTEKQIEKVTLILAMTQSTTQFWKDYWPQPAATEDEQRHRLHNFGSECRTPIQVIDTTVYLLRLYDRKRSAPLNPQQQKCLQDIEDQISSLRDLWDEIYTGLGHQSDGNN